MATHDNIAGYPAEIVPGRLYFVCMQQNTGAAPAGVPAGSLCYWLDHDVIYEPFCADFGPCNLAHTWRFCQRVNHLLKEGEARGVPAYLLVGPHPHKRANAAALVGIHSVLYLGKRAEEAYAPLRTLEPFAGFRDASCGVPTYTLGVGDVIRGAYRAKEVGFISWGPTGEGFDLTEYEHYEQVENGDLNWIVPGKLMAFSGPSATPKHYGGWRTFTPEDYLKYFEERGVTRVVRLNKKMYESARFTAHGVAHQDLYFPDGTCPPDHILYHFLEIAESEPGALAIHCKAGLGRTGVLICSYIIKHYGFTAEEAMGYIRICRPGSVIGPQQHYLMQHAPRLLHEGRIFRAAQVAAQAGGDPMAGAALVHSASGRQVVHVVATSRAADLGERRSPRLSSHQQAAAAARATSSPAKLVSSFSEEPNNMVSVPARHPPTSALLRKSSTASVHVSAAPGAATPPRPPTRAPMPSQHASPVSRVSSGTASLEGCATPPSAGVPRAMPPSSTKRMLAPNGQPRKIPLAMDLDLAVGSGALEDRDAEDLMQEDGWNGVESGDEAWTVSSHPAADRNYPAGSSRVGAFAAAAGRGANVFVEAFRSVVGSHRTNYSEARR